VKLASLGLAIAVLGCCSGCGGPEHTCPKLVGWVDPTGAGGAPPLVCDGTPLDTATILDLNVRAISVTGRVTLNGAALPSGATHRGWLVVTAAGDPKARTMIDLGATGAFSYTLRLAPGSYDVDYAPDHSASVASNATPSCLPSNGGRLRSAVALTADGILDIDIPVIEVSGAITLQGSALAITKDTAGLGAIGFARTGGGETASVTLGESGPASYLVRLIPGSYDVSLQTNPRACFNVTSIAALLPLPCNSGVIKESVPLGDSRVLDLDIPVVRVSGNVTLDGQPLPAEYSPRGQLQFVRRPTGSTTDSAEGATGDFGFSGAVSYALSLLPGQYDVHYRQDVIGCRLVDLPRVPCIGGLMKSAVDLSADSVVDVDLHGVEVTGRVTLRGQELPSGAEPLLFTGSTGHSVLIPVGAMGNSPPGTYSVRLLPDTYDVSYPSPVICDPRSGLPCTGGSFRTGLSLTSDQTLDLDIPAVTVTGRVTLAGQPLPDATPTRGSLAFAPVGSTTVAKLPLGSTGEGTYALMIWPGRYDVNLSANSDLCASAITPPALPCVGGNLLAGIDITADRSLDLDLRPIAVTGAVHLNDGDLPATSYDRGNIIFFPVAVPSDLGGYIPVGSSASPVNYTATMLPGRYFARFKAAYAACDGTMPRTVPCVSEVLVGCRAP
jgi:hypothetical protein